MGRGPRLLQPRHLGLEPANLGAEGVGRRRLGTALAWRQALQRSPAAGRAPRRQMRAVQPLATQQAADLARLATAVRFLDDPQSILGREPTAGRLGENLRVRSTPSRRGLGPGGRAPQGRRGEGVHPPAHIRVCLHHGSSLPPSNSQGSRCLSDVGREGWVSALRRSNACASAVFWRVWRPPSAAGSRRTADRNSWTGQRRRSGWLGPVLPRPKVVFAGR